MNSHVLSFAAILLGTPLAAHPHIFVDTGIDLIFDGNGQLTEVKVTWIYDEFYSLLVTEDRGFDPDFDGVLTDEELAALQGFDMQWVPGFNGDLVIAQGDQKLSLSGPEQATARYSEGRIATTHVRRVAPYRADAEVEALSIKPFDATYYTAYDLTGPIRLFDAPGCEWQVEEPDLEATLARLRTILDQLDAETTADDENLPDVGGLLASTVFVACDMS